MLTRFKATTERIRLVTLTYKIRTAGRILLITYWMFLQQVTLVKHMFIFFSINALIKKKIYESSKNFARYLEVGHFVHVIFNAY